MADPVKETEAHWEVKLPSEYAKFLKDKTYERYDNQYSNALSGGRGTQTVRFLVGESIYGVEQEDGDDFYFGNLDEDRERNPNLIPIAAFDASCGDGEIDSGALAIDVTAEKHGKCPVFQAGDGDLAEVAPSIADFLKTLSDEPHDDEDLDDD